MKCNDSQYRYLSDRQLKTHQQGTSLADFSSKCIFGRKAIDTFFGYVTVPSATKSAIETQGSVPLLQYSVSFRGGVFPIEQSTKSSNRIHFHSQLSGISKGSIQRMHFIADFLIKSIIRTRRFNEYPQ